MNRQKTKHIVLIVMCLAFKGLMAQNTLATTGNTITGQGGSVSYTLGQVFYATNTGTNGTVAQGVHQPFEISVVIGVEEAKGINLSVAAYPNPTTDFLTLEVDASTALGIESLSYQLYDLSGKLLQNEKITGSQTSIAVSNFDPSTYFIRLIQNNKEVKTFKIIKTQ